MQRSIELLQEVLAQRGIKIAAYSGNHNSREKDRRLDYWNAELPGGGGEVIDIGRGIDAFESASLSM